MDLSDSLLDRRQAAKVLGVDVGTVNKLVELELLQSYKIGSYRVFTREFLSDFVEFLKDASEDNHCKEVENYVG